MSPPLYCVFSVFQSTLLQEERPDPCTSHIHSFLLSIHAPTRGATITLPVVAVLPLLSIHAPTRGATIVLINSLAVSILSIHAPTRGATYVRGIKPMNHFFQSTLLQEERRETMLTYKINVLLSIHAPTRGATAKMHNIPYASLQ